LEHSQLGEPADWTVAQVTDAKRAVTAQPRSTSKPSSSFSSGLLTRIGTESVASCAPMKS